ncbi:hypothetical protein Tco_0615419 [Tanacetum coccineum]
MGGARGRVYAIDGGICMGRVFKTRLQRRRVKLSGNIDIEFNIVNEYPVRVNKVHETRFQMQQAELAALRETDRRRQAQMVETLRVIRDMRREMSDMQAELLALREQQRRARQPGPEARIPDHQDASGDADSHI